MPVPRNQTAITPAYRGRFAPTPSGPLHFGSIIAALGSFLEARRQQGEWLLRIEDIDQPRVNPRATDDILHCLDALALEWDGEVVYQSQRQDRYDEVIAQLVRDDLVFPCACSRKQLPPGPYPGTCRDGLPAGTSGRTLRLKTRAGIISFHDRLQGKYRQDLQSSVGDFIIHRGDDITSSHLCVVVDDHDSGITAIVRGMDLIDSTPRQLYLQESLALAHPQYLHLPVAVNPQGSKLSKQTHAGAIDPARGPEVLLQALRFLGQSPESRLRKASPREIIDWACAHWDIDRIPRATEIQAGPYLAGLTGSDQAGSAD